MGLFENKLTLGVKNMALYNWIFEYSLCKYCYFPYKCCFIRKIGNKINNNGVENLMLNLKTSNGLIQVSY